MKQILICAFLLISFAAFAQFPNLIETDINGVEHNLQEDYLDNGKPVLIHFFAAWNPWDQFFLDTNSMQTVYEIFGPDGTDQIMMLAYEMDSTTTDLMLEGNQPNFDYNFVDAYNFPILNPENTEFTSIMNLFAMPAIVVFCPDGSIYVDGQSIIGPDNYPVTIDSSIFYGELLVTNGVTNAFENTCGVNLADETISGHLTIDVDGTCVQNLDNPIPGALVYLDNGTDVEIRSSNMNGYYEALLVNGTYEISVDPQSSLITMCDGPDPIVINDNVVTGVDATFQADVLCPEIVLDVEPWLLRPCDRISYITTSVCNRGTVDASNFNLNVQFPAGSELLTVNTNDPYSYDMTTGLFTLACPALEVFNCKDLNFSFHTPCTSETGDSLCFGMTTEALSILPECTSYITTSVEDCSEVIGSYDPNDKQGLSQSTGDQNFIEKGTELEYMIRFQNTGNDTAFTVRIEDVLGPEFDKETIRPIASSHDYIMRLKENTVTFLFENILLVDSFKNEPESHGFITFTIDTYDDAEDGTKIDNTASIFFDTNEPVITNTFTYTVNLPVNVKDQELLDFTISPNPAGTYIQIDNLEEYSQDTEIHIVDIYGRNIYNTYFNNDRIDISHLSSGTYFAQLFDKERVLTNVKKFVVIK